MNDTTYMIYFLAKYYLMTYWIVWTAVFFFGAVFGWGLKMTITAIRAASNEAREVGTATAAVTE